MPAESAVQLTGTYMLIGPSDLLAKVYRLKIETGQKDIVEAAHGSQSCGC
ncbi:MAG: hypothetical protein JO249_21350 [Acidobacteria bacterium]|nr:hypothetical protein [Acidobacteriota bacterium]